LSCHMSSSGSLRTLKVPSASPEKSL
jgi:hypothetical protein